MNWITSWKRLAMLYSAEPEGQILFASHRAGPAHRRQAPLAGSAAASCWPMATTPPAAALNDVRIAHARLLEVRLKTPISKPGSSCASPPTTTPQGALELLVVGRDMTVQHATEERLRHMATHDGLTELPNRLLLSDRMRMVIANARRSGQAFPSPHRPGRLQESQRWPGPSDRRRRAAHGRPPAQDLRDSDTLARVGGDEFVAILPGTATEAQIKLVTGR
jgi:hypothetical protein